MVRSAADAASVASCPASAANLFGALTIGSPVSFAIALAVRSHSNILATEELLDEIGIEIPQGDGENQEVEKFREFLDQINPEDFVG